MKNITTTPIETLYKGILFRSRTEARWAVFFDSIGIKYHYEFECYNLEESGYYLPDFFLPDFHFGSFAEVKGIKFTEKEDYKCLELCSMTGFPVIMLDGPPSMKCYQFYEHHSDTNEILQHKGLIKADKGYRDNRMFIEPGYEQPDLSIEEDYYDCLGNPFIYAVNKAKSFRF